MNAAYRTEFMESLTPDDALFDGVAFRERSAGRGFCGVLGVYDAEGAFGIDVMVVLVHKYSGSST